MNRVLVMTVFTVVGALAFSACFSGYSETPDRSELRVRRASFTNEMVLSGEVEAARGEFLNVPPLPSWQTAIKWLAEEGTTVNAGDVVVELDNSSLTADLESKRQTATQALQEMQQKSAEWIADLEDKQLDVEKKKSELDKAAIEAAIPEDLESKKKHEEKKSTLRRTTVEYQKALDLRDSTKIGIEAERRNLALRIEKAQREIAIAEEAIAALVLRAPRAGIVVVRDHPWMGRKLQQGDPVWVGFPIAMLPDERTLRVKAVLADVDDGKIAVGMPATITLDGYPAMPYTGRIAAISAVAQESKRQSLRRQFDVLVSFDRLDPQRMRPGLSARIIVRRASMPNALLAPRAAIDLSGKNPRARTASGSMKDVQVGPCNAQDCVITSGLEEGDKLATIVEVRRG
jgi:HlyD family secretion protein